MHINIILSDDGLETTKLPASLRGRMWARGWWKRICYGYAQIKKRQSWLLSLNGMTSSEFENKFESGAMGDDQDYFVWWSLIRGLEALRARKDF